MATQVIGNRLITAHVPWWTPRRALEDGASRRHHEATSAKKGARPRSAVGIGAVRDADDAYEHLVVVDGVDDPVLAPPGRPVALKLEP